MACGCGAGVPPAPPGLSVPVLQQSLKVRRTHQLVLHVAQDDHLACPVVPDTDGHQLLFQRGETPVSSPLPPETR